MTNKELAIHVGNKIKAIRKSKKWTQHQLATQLNTTKATISNYETGYRSPKNDMLFTIADVFNISIDDFFPPLTTEQEGQPSPSANHPSKNSEKLNIIFSQLDDTTQNKLLQIAKDLLSKQPKRGAKQSKSPPGAASACNDSIPSKDSVVLNCPDPCDDRFCCEV